jgi:hypothetical protein
LAEATWLRERPRRDDRRAVDAPGVSARTRCDRDERRQRILVPSILPSKILARRLVDGYNPGMIRISEAPAGR